MQGIRVVLEPSNPFWGGAVSHETQHTTLPQHQHIFMAIRNVVPLFQCRRVTIRAEIVHQNKKWTSRMGSICCPTEAWGDQVSLPSKAPGLSNAFVVSGLENNPSFRDGVLLDKHPAVCRKGLNMTWEGKDGSVLTTHQTPRFLLWDFLRLQDDPAFGGGCFCLKAGLALMRTVETQENFACFLEPPCGYTANAFSLHWSGQIFTASQLFQSKTWGRSKPDVSKGFLPLEKATGR